MCAGHSGFCARTAHANKHTRKHAKTREHTQTHANTRKHTQARTRTPNTRKHKQAHASTCVCGWMDGCNLAAPSPFSQCVGSLMRIRSCSRARRIPLASGYDLVDQLYANYFYNNWTSAEGPFKGARAIVMTINHPVMTISHPASPRTKPQATHLPHVPRPLSYPSPCHSGPVFR